MKVIIAGSRDNITYEDVIEAINRFQSKNITEVVSGTARGVDRFGEELAQRNSCLVKQFPADWDTYGKKAGYLRNTIMANYADALIAIWDGESRGTKHMIDEATKLGLIVSIYCPNRFKKKEK